MATVMWGTITVRLDGNNKQITAKFTDHLMVLDLSTLLNSCYYYKNLKG